MDCVAFLNSSGAIVAAPGAPTNSMYAAHIPFDPCIETVYLPVVSVDSSALYGEQPENLARLTYTSGAALTFFCDSIEGGDETAGAGTADNPWRSMNTALRFLSCNLCVLNAAAPYVQLKVRGTVDYPGWPSRWNPSGYYGGPWEKLILTGWGEQTDLTSAMYSAGYCFNLKLRLHAGYAFPTCSGCTLIDEGGVRCAVNCEITNSSLSPNSADVAYDCSGMVNMISCGVLYGGSFGNVGLASARNCVCYANYAYSATVTASRSGDTDFGLTEALYLKSAAAGVTATMSCGGSPTARAMALPGGAVYLRDCTATAVAANSSGDCTAVAVAAPPSAPPVVIDGGIYTASAVAVRSQYYSLSATARICSAAGGVSYSGVQTTVFASAKLYPNSDAAFTETESVYDLGGSCIRERGLKRNESGVLVPFSTSSGGLCS